MGEKNGFLFSDRKFAAIFPEILVFSTAVSIYGLFVLSIKNKRKKWVNFLLFFGGLLFASLPFLAFHGYYQYQCSNWNSEIVSSENILYNNYDTEETVRVIKSKCKFEDEIKTDTIFVKNYLMFFEMHRRVNIIEVEKSNWSESPTSGLINDGI